MGQTWEETVYKEVGRKGSDKQYYSRDIGRNLTSPRTAFGRSYATRPAANTLLVHTHSEPIEPISTRADVGKNRGGIYGPSNELRALQFVRRRFPPYS